MRSLLVAASVLLPLPVFAQTNATGLKAPPGFEVVEFADGKLANDIQVMTVDPKGRVTVAGRGYIRILVDDDGDGKADRAIDFADSPRDGAMGLLWEGDTLFVMGDGGLRRFRSKNDRADGPSELIRAMKTAKSGGEHSSHAIRRGPDGWIYVLGGNNSGIDKSYAELPTSPVKDPIAGCVLRFQPDLKKCEIVAHGFRNPYGFDFNLEGDLFTYDSDNERCVSLPWYEPTRFYHVIDGRHYGWMNPQHAITWRRPPYFCDVVAPIATLGRGSPTGVVCYAHNQFPPEYHGGFFLGDWTFGKIHFAKLERKGATYTAQTRVFLESTGDNGFAPTASAVDPTTGDLYISIGGRGTRGAVYRVRHPARFAAMKGKLASLPMAKRSLEWSEGLKKEIQIKAKSQWANERLWALQMTRRHFTEEQLKKEDIQFKTNAGHSDRAVRNAIIDIFEAWDKEGFIKKARMDMGLTDAEISAWVAYGIQDFRFERPAGISLLLESNSPEDRLEGIRIYQRIAGDIGTRASIGTIWEGYSPRLAIKDTSIATKLAPMFPSGHHDLDYELARTLGMLRHADADLRVRVLAQCTAESSPIDDIHYLACYAGLGGLRVTKETTVVAATLLDLDRKITQRKLNRDSNWAPRVQEMYIGLAEKDPALPKAIVEHPAFGRPDHALFANTPGFPKERAAHIFLERWRKDSAFALSANIVQLFDALPAEDVLPTVRKRWGEIGQEASLLPLLARQPLAEDRTRFIDGLNSPQDAVAKACLAGLAKLDGPTDANESFALIRALHRSSDKQIALRQALAARLSKTTGQALGADSKRWIAWLQEKHPEFGKRLANPDGVDVVKWDQRLAGVRWDDGKADAGRAVFVKASCITCHSGSQALGPDLIGVTSRFSRADLLTAILQPSKDVPTRYQTTVVETRAGKTYQGIVIYDAVDSLILQTGAASTVRLDGATVATRFVTAQSLMPAGLLDPLSDKEIADLYAYLRSLGKSP